MAETKIDEKWDDMKLNLNRHSIVHSIVKQIQLQRDVLHQIRQKYEKEFN